MYSVYLWIIIIKIHFTAYILFHTHKTKFEVNKWKEQGAYLKANTRKVNVASKHFARDDVSNSPDETRIAPRGYWHIGRYKRL